MVFHRANAGWLILAYVSRELIWLAPFVCVGLVALAPLRAGPVFPAPFQSRIVTDATGTNIAVPLPFRTIAGSHYLQVSHAPETLSKIGGPQDRLKFAGMLMSRFFPELVKDDALWDSPSDIESIYAHADGVTFFFGERPYLWRRLGLPVLSTGFNYRNPDESIFAVVRTVNAALGHEAYGETLIAGYQQVYTDINRELHPETLTDIPRVLSMGCSLSDWGNIWVFGARDTRFDDRRIGVENATAGFEDTGRQQEAERILAMNPDFIFVGGESIDAFKHDARWQGLKAVLNQRVYGGGTGFRPGLPTWNLDERPLGARQVAEIVHPDRLQPKLRMLVRDHFLKSYGYRLSVADIDKMLGIEAQKNVPGYARFMTSDLAGARQEVSP